MRLRPRGPLERATTMVANANQGYTAEQLLTDVGATLPALLAKHRHLGTDLSPLAADLVLVLVDPLIRDRVIES